MGNELSQEQIDPTHPPRTLKSRDLKGVAEFIANGRAKRIVVLTGAGISTSAGIPDFRSPDTGLYANLARLDLPYAEAVFDISYFRNKPEPFYVLAKELYPGNYSPTIAHSFIALLSNKDLLLQLFTQNIDCLERRAGVSNDKIVEAHGSFATQRCIECKSDFPAKIMKEVVEKGSVPHCLVPQCNGLVKPDIVFFGEALPSSFREKSSMLAEADLLIIMGTSLSVAPFSTLPQFARDGVPRVLFNKDVVGDIGTRLDDVVVLGDCDEGVRKLADLLGWREELKTTWLDVAGPVSDASSASLQSGYKSKSQDGVLHAEIDNITREVQETLRISADHANHVKATLERDTGTVVKVTHEGGNDNGAAAELPTSHHDIANQKDAATESQQSYKDSGNLREDPDPTLPQNRPQASIEHL